MEKESNLTEEKICEKAKKLNLTIQTILNELNDQNLEINNINYQTEMEIKKFNDNQELFIKSVEKFKSDGRNALIVFLTIVIIILSILFRTES
ncbi:hypothetical protein EBI_26117 [Enterocytozoon bieneusi H348]|nr:hypothetical protein EBI_26117 [Enterocytozoon bieneusi H348]|eukprot:XP_002649594.1 hypothetical protein EBI_26117 [Enterocytozoon bieneusi H348]